MQLDTQTLIQIAVGVLVYLLGHVTHTPIMKGIIVTHASLKSAASKVKAGVTSRKNRQKAKETALQAQIDDLKKKLDELTPKPPAPPTGTVAP